MCLIRLQYDTNTDFRVHKHAVKLDVATIACDGDGEENLPVKIMDFDFFDDKYVVLIIKTEKSGELEGKLGQVK